MTTRAMRVANIAFLLDRLAADTPPNQQIRELTQNAIEAIQRRQRNGDSREGIIRWDIDWDHLNRANEYKLSVVDNGDGMNPDQMDEYLNSLAVQGAGATQSISQNFGVGAKITALYRNRYGLIYQSWIDSKGAMVKLHRDDKQGVYGLASFNLEDGPHFSPRIKDSIKPRTIEESGTKVTLLGTCEEDNTCRPAESSGGGMNWLIRYLTSRYFRIPGNIRMQARVLTRDVTTWPDKEPPSSEKTFNLQTIKGAKALFDDYADRRGAVRLQTADVHWWLFEDPRQASKDMSTRGGRTCHVGIVFQNEVYISRTPPAARRILASFGVVFGAEHVIIYVEPRDTLNLRADTARSRIAINGEDVEEANWWDVWGAEFRGKMPAEMKAMIDEIMARADKDPEGKARQRIIERLRRIRELLRPTRYRKDPEGSFRAIGDAPGGVPASSDHEHAPGPSSGGHRGGRISDDYLAELVDSDGEPATSVTPPQNEPEVVWVSRSDGTREEEELEDVAAEISGDVITSNIIKVNADFRGYRDLVTYFEREFNPNGDALVQRKIVEYIQEWMEGQLIEVVMVTRNLVNGRTWTRNELQHALSSHALTAVLTARFHIVEKVKRSLSSEITKPNTKTAPRAA